MALVVVVAVVLSGLYLSGWFHIIQHLPDWAWPKPVLVWTCSLPSLEVDVLFNTSWDLSEPKRVLYSSHSYSASMCHVYCLWSQFGSMGTGVDGSRGKYEINQAAASLARRMPAGSDR